MKNSQLSRAVGLIRRTGDRCLIMDNESEAVLMMMDLDQYEKLLDNHTPVEHLNEEEMLDKINRDMSIWRSHHQDDELNDFEPMENEENIAPWEVDEDKNENKKEEPDPFREDEEIQDFIPEKLETHISDSPAAESLEDVQEEEEEKFYLEPVE